MNPRCGSVEMAWPSASWASCLQAQCLASPASAAATSPCLQWHSFFAPGSAAAPSACSCLQAQWCSPLAAAASAAAAAFLRCLHLQCCSSRPALHAVCCSFSSALMLSYSSRVPHIRVIAFTCFPLSGHRWAGTPLLRFGLAHLILDGFVQVVRLQAEFVNRVGAAGAQ